MSSRLLVALTLTTAAAWRFPGLARPREEDVIEVTPTTGPRELSIETHDYEAHESTMVLPFEDTHACLLQSLKDYLDTHAEDQFESKIMLKIGGHRVDSNAADYFRMMPDGVCARRPTFLRRGDGVHWGAATLPYAIDAMPCAGHLQDADPPHGAAAGAHVAAHRAFVAASSIVRRVDGVEADASLMASEAPGATRTPSPRPRHTHRVASMAWSLPHTGIIGSQKTLRLQDLLILATDTESLHPDIDTDIVLSTDFAEIHPWLVVWHGNEIPVLQYLHDHNYVCYKEGHEHWCVGGQRAIAAGLTEFCGCQHIYAGCQAFPADPAATPPPTDED